MSRKRTGRAFLTRGPRTRGIWMETRRLAQIKMKSSDAITKSRNAKKIKSTYLSRRSKEARGGRASPPRRGWRRTGSCRPPGSLLSQAHVQSSPSWHKHSLLLHVRLESATAAAKNWLTNNNFLHALLCCWPAASERDSRLAVRK
jgi:hypothetical protein